MKRPIRWILAAFLMPLIGICLLLANFFQVMSLILAPFSAKAFRAVNRSLYSGWFNVLRWSLEGPLGVQILQTGDPIPWKENAFLMANHQAMADIPALIAIAHRSGRKGDLKWFVKDPLKWTPGIGWGLQFVDCLFVKRNWTADKEKVLATFAKIRSHSSPFWVISFLEGTRSSPQKIARSQDFARRQGMEPLRHVMLPRTKGFEASLEGLGSMTQAVYDATIAYEGRPPKLLELFFGPVRRIHVHMRRFTELPEENRSAWVLERYQEKDALLEHFKTHGHFP